MRRFRALVVFLSLSAASLPVYAAPRVFVSGGGMDSGACPITAPCRSFSYALTQVSAGGEIIALDTAGYGVVSVSQAVTIVAAPGVTAFVAASVGTAIDVVAGASDTVTLRGLALTSTGATRGVSFGGGQALNVENCVIHGFNIGVDFVRTGDTSHPRVTVVNTTFRNNTTGINVQNLGAGTPAGGPPANLSYASISGSYFTGSLLRGVLGNDNARIAVSDSVFSGNLDGVQAYASVDYSYSEVNLERCTLSRNGAGVDSGDTSGSQLPRGVVRVANAMITGNDVGIQNSANGFTLTRVSNSVYTNTLEGNGTDGAFTGVYSGK